MSDQFFTPTEVAKELTSSLRMRSESVIADFAAGDGELLLAARARWPKAKFVATDLINNTVQRLRRAQPTWSVGMCDFTRSQSRDRSNILHNLAGKVTLVLLNPPFSCRGGRRMEVKVGDRTVKCSLALAFIFHSVPYLSPKGRIAAVLPASSLTSQKDREAWAILRTRFKVETSTSYGPRTFANCSARTVTVTLTTLRQKTHESPNRAKRREQSEIIRVRIVRGVTSIHAALNGLAGKQWSLVHTTNLQENSISGTRLMLNRLKRYVNGPAILLPRVGKPDKRKCVLYLQNQRIVLSDCVFALACDSRSAAELLHARIMKSWDAIAELAYGGTCAPYATCSSLTAALSVVGCECTDLGN